MLLELRLGRLEPGLKRLELGLELQLGLELEPELGLEWRLLAE